MAGIVETVGRRATGDFGVDEWGLDPHVIGLLGPLADLRWSIEVDGAAHLPADGPALLVHHPHLGPAASAVLAHGVRSATGRPLRIAGVPDVAVLGPSLRKLGGVLDRADEIGAVLRAGHLVSVRIRRWGGEAADASVVARVGAARSIGAPVHPVATFGGALSRRWRVVVGPAIEVGHGAGPLGDAEVADEARRAVRRLLDTGRPV